MALLPSQGHYLPIDCLTMYVITTVWIPLLYDAMMLLVSSWSAPIDFCNRLSNFAFLIAKKYGQPFFLYFLFHFHCTPLHCLRFVVNVFLVCMFFFYLSHSWLDFNETGNSLYFMHTLQVQQFLKLPYKLTLDGTLHSTVNDFITNNSVMVFSSNSTGRLIS